MVIILREIYRKILRLLVWDQGLHLKGALSVVIKNNIRHIKYQDVFKTISKLVHKTVKKQVSDFTETKEKYGQ